MVLHRVSCAAVDQCVQVSKWAQADRSSDRETHSCSESYTD
jgi:hypothetical protein